MKKKVSFLTIVLFAAIMANAQNQPQIANGNFEQWEEISCNKGQFWDLKENSLLTTLNQLYELDGESGNAPLTAFRESDAIEGYYALKLVSNQMVFGNIPIFLPGACANFYIDIFNTDCVLGTEFTARPSAMTGWYKYTPVNNDSAAFEVALKKNGNIVGSGKMVIKESVNSYIQFSVPINYVSEETPDTIIVIASASAKYDFSNITTLMQCKGQVGSTLYVDDLLFEYSNGIKERLTSSVQAKVMPNPSSEQINLVLGKEINGNVKIYDNIGRLINSYSIEGNEMSISLENYANGQYLINVEENNKVVASTRFIKQ